MKKIKDSSVNNVLVSIVTIVLNGEDHIEQTINSVINQTYKRIEYIIIDGGSTDDTIKIIERYKDRINIFVSKPDNGIYDAINKGISYVNGSLVGLIHCGDYYEPDAVSNAINAYLRTEADVIYGDLRIIENEGSEKVVRIQKSKHKDLKNRMSISHPATFISRNCYQKYGLYDCKYKLAADYDFILKLFLADARFHYINKILANFRAGGLSGTDSKLSMRENVTIRKNHLGNIYSIKYAIMRTVRDYYFSRRKLIIQKCIGKRYYSRMKQIYYELMH